MYAALYQNVGMSDTLQIVEPLRRVTDIINTPGFHWKCYIDNAFLDQDTDKVGRQLVADQKKNLVRICSPLLTSNDISRVCTVKLREV